MRVSVAVAAAVLTMLATAPDPAQAALTAVGPIDPATRAPAYFEDANGLQLTLCHPGTPNCGPIAPGEDFYFQAISTISIPGGGLATLILNLTQAPNLSGNPAVFSRVRIQLDGFPGGSYTVTHPYGTDAVDVVPGRRGRTTIDDGCLADAVGGLCDFASTLNGRVGPFLTPAPAAPAPPAGFIGDSATQVPVTGSPTGANLFRVEGPGLPAGGVTSTTFALTGRQFTGAEPAFGSSSGSLAFGGQPVGTRSTRTLTVTSEGIPGPGSDLSISGVTLGGANASDYAVAETCAGRTLASGQGCRVDVTFTPSATGARSATLTFTDNAGQGTHAVALSGTGTSTTPAPAPSAPAVVASAPVRAPAPAPAPLVVAAPRPTVSADTFRIGALTVARRVHARSLRRSLAVHFRVAPGITTARVRLVTLARRRQIASKVVDVLRPGRQAVHLRSRKARPGRYLVEVRVGTNWYTYGDPAFAHVTLVR